MMKGRSIFAIPYDADKRILGLDIFRAISILIVLKVHANDFLQYYFPALPASVGIGGPELFFVLSGYLIGQILFKQIEAKENFGWRDVLQFLQRRWWRTLPNYYLFLAFHFIILVTIQNTFDASFHLKYIFFLQNLWHPIGPFYAESWSLSIEEWFYLSLPCWLLFFLRGGRSSGNRSMRMLRSLLIYILLIFVLRMLFFTQSNTEFNLVEQVRSISILRLDSIMIGVLAAWMKTYRPHFWQSNARLFFGVGLLLIYLTHLSREWQSDFFLYNFHFPLKSLGAALLLSLADRIRRAPAWIVKVFTHISLVSYSMYLLNLPLRSFVIMPMHRHWGLPPFWSFIFFFVLCILISTLIYKYYEKPLTAMREGKSWMVRKR